MSKHTQLSISTHHLELNIQSPLRDVGGHNLDSPQRRESPNSTVTFLVLWRGRYREGQVLYWGLRRCFQCDAWHHQHQCLVFLNPRQPRIEAPRQLEPKELIWGINPGQRLAWTDPLGCNCLGSTSPVHLEFRHPSQLCCQYGLCGWNIEVTWSQVFGWWTLTHKIRQLKPWF